MTEGNPFLSGPQFLKRDQPYATPQDISRLRQRMLNLEEELKQVKQEVEDLKNK
jgi:hypothetical protein